MKFILEPDIKKKDISKIDFILLPIWLEKGAVIRRGDLFGKFDDAAVRSVNAFVERRNLKNGDSKMMFVAGKPEAIFLAFFDKTNKSNLVSIIRKFIRVAKSEKLRHLGVFITDFISDKLSGADIIELIARESLLADYDFAEKYKTSSKDELKNIEKFYLLDVKNDKFCNQAVTRGMIVGNAINKSRTISNYPGGDMTPEGLAEAARDLGRRNSDLKVAVFDERKMKAIGMNAILAVGRGSMNPPRFILIEYRGSNAADGKIALIGKGITFDSGGLNIKPGDSMADMHLDMSGGAAVIAAMEVIAELKLPINVIGMVAAAENMPSGISYRQGDIIKSFSGKTIEIGNTDAEGRVVLADAIAYAKTKNPTLIVTLATLTGASMVALGTRMSALFVKDNKPLRDMLEKIGIDSGDIVWPLPLTSDNERDVDGTFADVTNTSKNHSRYGGASTGAAFLSRFADGATFAHIDMAPRMMTNSEEDHLSKGSAGFGVRFFLELADRWDEVRSVIK